MKVEKNKVSIPEFECKNVLGNKKIENVKCFLFEINLF